MNSTEAVVLGGALLGGFVSGLSGFGTGLTALPLWLMVLTPPLAAPLVTVCSLVAQLQALPAVWQAVDHRQATPFVIGGLVGVPIGAAVIPIVSVELFSALVAVLIFAYCAQVLLSRAGAWMPRSGRIADVAVGVGGGFCGGLAGLPGPLPTLWAGLRGWEKDRRRAVLQPYTLSVLVLAIAAQAYAGLLTREFAGVLMAALPGTVVGTWIGRRIYVRLDTSRFERVVVTLLTLSAIGIVLKLIV